MNTTIEELKKEIKILEGFRLSWKLVPIKEKKKLTLKQKKELLLNLKSLLKQFDKIINILLNDEHDTDSELGSRYYRIRQEIESIESRLEYVELK